MTERWRWWWVGTRLGFWLHRRRAGYPVRFGTRPSGVRISSEHKKGRDADA